MSKTEAKATEVLQELRHEGEALRRLPGNRKGNLPESRRHELSLLVAKSLSADVPFETIKDLLTPFPPQVVGRAMASVWRALEPRRQEEVLERVRALDSERLLGEALPMSLHLLKSAATGSFGSEVLGILPPTEKTAQRVAAEVFGSDGIAIAALRAPGDESAALKMFRVLLKAASHEKAQPYRRLQLLRLVVPWLAHEGRYRRAAYSEVVGDVRGLTKGLDGSVAAEWVDTLGKEPTWSLILTETSGQTPPTPQPVATTTGSVSPSRLAETSAQEALPPRSGETTALPPAPLLSLEEARSTLQSLKDHRLREARALERLLGELKAVEASKGQNESDFSRARERELRFSQQLAEQGTQLEQLRVEVARLTSRSAAADAEAAAKNAECERLAGDLAAARTQGEALRAEQQRQVAAWREQKHQLEVQVVQNADARISELRQRLGSRLEKVLGDVPKRSADIKGESAASVLHTRIHELLDLLRKEGVPIEK